MDTPSTVWLTLCGGGTYPSQHRPNRGLAAAVLTQKSVVPKPGRLPLVVCSSVQMLSASEPEIESYLWSQAVPRLQFGNSNRSTRAAIRSVIVARRNDSPSTPSALVAATLVNGTSLVRMGFCANWCPGLCWALSAFWTRANMPTLLSEICPQRLGSSRYSWCIGRKFLLSTTVLPCKRGVLVLQPR